MSDPINTGSGSVNAKISHLDNILDEADLALQALTEAGVVLSPALPAAAMLADKLLHVIQAAVRAHEQATGEPLDMSKLHEIEPLPEPGSGDIGDEG